MSMASRATLQSSDFQVEFTCNADHPASPVWLGEKEIFRSLEYGEFEGQKCCELNCTLSTFSIVLQLYEATVS